jgi:NTP pyrophosphatase (non-canonical NTP hydrolase)
LTAPVEPFYGGVDGFNKYMTDAAKTSGPVDSPRDRLILAGLGVAGEAGELADHIKKLTFHGHAVDQAAIDKLIDEGGDVLWYLGHLARALGVPLSTFAENNRKKLLLRYPEGFSEERSKNRA